MSKSEPNAVASLSPFDGRDVLQSTIKVTKAGDGLSSALAVEPTEWHIGDEVCVVLRCEVGKVTHEELSDTGTLRRVHTLVTADATIVAPDTVAQVLDEQRRKINAAKGISELPFDGDEEGADDE